MSNVSELKRPSQKQSLSDFLDNVSEDELLAQLEGSVLVDNSAICPKDPNAPLDTFALETNTRLTVIKMMETVPQMEQPFTFRVRRYCGAAYIQAMRTTLARARKYAKEQNYDMGEPFRMVQLHIETEATCDVVSVMRVAKGKRLQTKLDGLARLLGGSHVQEDEDDEE